MTFCDCIKKQVLLRATFLGLIATLVVPQAARADLLELINGDHYRGTVVSMTTSNLEFISEIQGRVILPRSKIAQITFRDVAPRPVAARPVTNAPLILTGANSAPPTADPTGLNIGIPQPIVTQPAPSVAIVQQMQQQGVDPKLVSQIQEQIFGKASPQAAAQFNQMMTGVMSGQVSVRDIRDQAQRAIVQIQTAKKELGPDAGEMLDGYLTILQKFVNDAATDNTIVASPTTR